MEKYIVYIEKKAVGIRREGKRRKRERERGGEERLIEKYEERERGEQEVRRK